MVIQVLIFLEVPTPLWKLMCVCVCVCEDLTESMLIKDPARNKLTKQSKIEALSNDENKLEAAY